jgi:6-phosphogluconolactonase
MGRDANIYFKTLQDWTPLYDICTLSMKKLFLALGILLPCFGFTQTEKEILYVGTHSVRDSKGIYVFELNRVKGSLRLIQTIVDLQSPGFLAIHPSGKYLYSVNAGSTNGDSDGSASAFSIHPKTGKLTFINHVSSYGKNPCHIAIDRTGEWAFISNYNEGNFIVLPILQDGSLGAPTDSKKYYGNSVNKFRQNQPHIHSANVSADNRFVYVSDLGTDRIYTYALDVKNGKINPAARFEVQVLPGSGPRHFTFHPKGMFAYSAEELSSTVGVFAVDQATGGLTIIQDTVRSLPKEFTEINTSADIHTDPDGRFLYLSNRGADVLSVFSISQDGTITYKGVQKTMGKTPRNFLVDKKGKFIWIANQNSDNITVFKINPRTGMPVYTGIEVKLPSPVCIKQLVLK